MQKLTAFVAIGSAFLLAVSPLYASVDHSPFQTSGDCLVCHPLAQPTHSLATPSHNAADLPLDSQGRIECFTCHNCINGTCLLRRGGSPMLCTSCHDCTRGMACVLGIAHLGDSRQISRGSKMCLGCHDGTEGGLVVTGQGHKVEVLYLTGPRFNALADAPVILVNGRVTCVSCHNPYKNDRERLVRSNRGSALCLTCHRI